jgi:hypothetical protein
VSNAIVTAGLKLHRGNVHQVAPQHELLALALDDVDRVARRVTMGRHRLHAGDEFGIAFECLEFAGVHVRLERRHRALDEALLVLGRRVERLLRQPEVGVTLVGAHDCVGKHRLALGCQSADVSSFMCVT